MSQLTQPVYKELAAAIQARANCLQSGNTEWFDKWSERIETIQKELPSGSGIDNGTTVDVESSTGERIVLHFGFHHMTEGMYDGWTDHTVTVTGSLQSEINIRISGRNRNDIKDYLFDVYFTALTAAFTA